MKRFNSLLGAASLFLALCTLTPVSAFSQENQLNRIKLTWDSYAEVKDSKRPYIAYTAHQTTHKYRATQKGTQLSLKFMVGVALDRKQSVVDFSRLSALDEEAKKNLLNHEQGHSDLAVLYGRILYKNLSKRLYSIKNYQQEVKKVYDDTMKELGEIHFRYDMETAHGEEKELQDKWDLYFKKELKG
ncbi:DUF922 domain-containing protein [Pedobacter gandavensis]|uniref:DUF922 domain-containing protein n=1 Tax=Pedobacter gandavensis TaxID=2679963 RepID=UPI00292DB3A8|nr:DUF922 domain-containing protein [Pedobacter gandavensis]